MWRLPKQWHRAAVCFLLALAIASFMCVRERTRETHQENLLDMYVRRHGRYRILEKSICLMDGSCVAIVDSVEFGNQKNPIFRAIVLRDLWFSRMGLMPPYELNDDSLDSSRWKLDKGAIDFNSYLVTMIEEMFASGTVEIRRDAVAKVLCVGLGGGYLNSYLHHHFPKMDITIVELDPMMLRIARKWFGLDEDHRQRVIIDDGLNYIKRAAESGIQYGVVHLDVCTTDPNAKHNCPLDDFVSEDALSVLSKLISRRGVVIVNVISTKYDSRLIAKQMKSHFEKFFHQCVLKPEPYSLNVVMSCSFTTRPKGLDAVYREFAGYSRTHRQILL